MNDEINAFSSISIRSFVNVNLKHNILKTYWKLKLPFSDEEIQQGVQDVDVWLCSPGGAGSNMFKNYLHEYVKVKSPKMAGLLTHHSEPINCDKQNYKAIYLHRHPIKALRSMKRRGLVKTNIRKLNNSRGLPETDEELLKSVFNQFDNWTTKPINYPILCIKYASLFENRDKIGEFLGLDMTDFPDPNFTAFKGTYNSHLKELFSEEIANWEAYPDVVLRQSGE